MSLAYFLQQRLQQLAQYAQQGGATLGFSVSTCGCGGLLYEFALSSFVINQNTGQITISLGQIVNSACSNVNVNGYVVFSYFSWGGDSSTRYVIPCNYTCGFSQPSSITITITPGSVYST